MKKEETFFSKENQKKNKGIKCKKEKQRKKRKNKKNMEKIWKRKRKWKKKHQKIKKRKKKEAPLPKKMFFTWELHTRKSWGFHKKNTAYARLIGVEVFKCLSV